jgi:peptide/nickel transport system permease protein
MWLAVVTVWVVVGNRLADQSALVMGVRFSPPNLAHLFGTDDFGRDILARVIVGARVLFAVGIIVAVSSTALGALTGLTASSSPAIDKVLMRILDGFMAFPAAILAIGIIAALGAAHHPGLVCSRPSHPDRRWLEFSRPGRTAADAIVGQHAW